MRRKLLLAPLLSAIVLVLVVVGTGMWPIFAQQEATEGIFGKVTGISAASPGLTVLTIRTLAGEDRTVEAAAESAAIMIPGRETATAVDIALGDFLAVRAARRADGRLHVIKALVRPERPVLHTHVTGTIIGVEEGQVAIMDRDGNLVTADFLPDGDALESGQVLTAVVRHHPRADSLSVLAVERAETKIDRLQTALQQAVSKRATQNQENLGARLRADITGHLTVLREYLNRADPGAEDMFFDTLDDSASLLTSFDLDLGSPSLKVSGRIQRITGGTLFVAPAEGPEVELRITDETSIRLFGRSSSQENLQEFHLVEAVYTPRPGAALTRGEALTIDVLFPFLTEPHVRALPPQVLAGELEGVIRSTDVAAVPQTLSVEVAPDRVIPLTVASAIRVRIGDRTGGLDELATLISVKVMYNPATMEALDIQTLDLRPREEFVSGVVKGLIPKTKPVRRIQGSREEGNILIARVDGRATALTVTDETIIVRDGQRVGAAAMKVGDLVRPTTAYDVGSGEIRRLSLKSPQLRGTLRGVLSAPSGRDYLTLSTEGLGLITVNVLGHAEVLKDGEAVDVSSLELREIVVSGVYSPDRLLASSLVVAPPSALRATGAVSELDRERGIVTIALPSGESIVLLIPNKPGIVVLDGKPGATRDLGEGDSVLAAYYRPGLPIVVRIVVRSG